MPTEVEGKMFLVLDPATKYPEEELAKKVLALEQYLNNDVATDVYKRFHVGLRFHLSIEHIKS